uniref:Capsid protein n=1 Tax=Red panda feces-associated gemycircularvirus TaxID=2864013 RepID=A0A8K1HIM8_9VIRU|nr:capsid protein [Red panda feces-associated gemycircularvirus]
MTHSTAWRKRQYQKRARYARKYASSAKTRPYRKTRRTYRRKVTTMSRRRLLNITSEKKHDKMLVTTNASASSSAGTTYTANPAILTGGYNVPYTFVWCATARDLSISPSVSKGSKSDIGTRTTSSPFMVGLSEKIEIQTVNGTPWQWRRICFTAKMGANLNGVLPDSASFHTNLEASNGFQRVVNTVLDGIRPNFEALLFMGEQNVDWNDQMVAPVDNRRVNLKYDKTITIAAGNEDGTIRSYKRWHPMRKTLMYDDDERGGTLTQAGTSVYNRQGMGDYWVVDYIRPRSGAVAADQLLFRPEATLYWHER